MGRGPWDPSCQSYHTIPSAPGERLQSRGYLVDPASIICLSPRLSHARLSTALERQNYAELHRTVAILPHDRRRPSRVGATDNPTKGEANTLILTPKGERPLTRYAPGGFAGVDLAPPLT